MYCTTSTDTTLSIIIGTEYLPRSDCAMAFRFGRLLFRLVRWTNRRSISPMTVANGVVYGSSIDTDGKSHFKHTSHLFLCMCVSVSLYVFICFSVCVYLFLCIVFICFFVCVYLFLCMCLSVSLYVFISFSVCVYSVSLYVFICYYVCAYLFLFRC